MDERTHKQIYEMTTEAYSKACKIVGYSNMDLRSQLLDWEITNEDANRKAEELDEVYRGLICKFPSFALTHILLSNDEGRVKRAKKTLDSIASELLERELRGEEKGNT